MIKERLSAEADEKELTRARNAAYRYLTYRPRSRSEVEAKLRDKGFGNAVIQETLSGLVRLGYVDDEKFAHQWAQNRARLRSFGRRRIEQELRNKGVEREIAGRALSELFSFDTEIETARKAALGKVKAMQSLDPETKRRRLAGFLERKGFSSDVIHAVLKNID